MEWDILQPMRSLIGSGFPGSLGAVAMSGAPSNGAVQVALESFLKTQERGLQLGSTVELIGYDNIIQHTHGWS